MDIEAGLWAFSVILCSKVSYENQLPATDCDICGLWQHRACGNTGLTSYMYGLLRRKKISFQFVCDLCNSKPEVIGVVDQSETAFCIDTSSNVTNLCPWGCCNSGFCCAEPSTSYFWLFGLLGAVITFFLILYFFRKCCSRPSIVQTSRDMGEMSQVNFAHSSRNIPAYYDPPPYISTISGTNPPVFPADCDLLPPYELPPSYEDACKGNNDNEQR